jgi:hypothetical protein
MTVRLIFPNFYIATEDECKSVPRPQPKATKNDCFGLKKYTVNTALSPLLTFNVNKAHNEYNLKGSSKKIKHAIQTPLRKRRKLIIILSFL